MKISSVLVLAFAVSSFQLRLPGSRANQRVRFLDCFANSTSAAARLGATKNFTTFAGGLPPPVPLRPAPKPPGEPYLSLYASASDDAWEKAKCKGANFVRAMRGSDREAGQVFQPPRDSAAAAFENIEYGMLA